VIAPEHLRVLELPSLAIELLRTMLNQGGPLHPNNLFRSAEQAFERNREPDVPALLNRLSDAWAWLESRGLLGPDPTQTSGEWRRVTGRGRHVISTMDDPVPTLAAEERLEVALHERLAGRVRRLYLTGDFETAAFAAMKEVEVRVRALAGAPESAIGVRLMRDAFKEGGPLRDPAADPGEQVATMELFAGAIGLFKNPVSHRPVNYRDPTEASEIILFADLLLRLLDSVAERLPPS